MRDPRIESLAGDIESVDQLADMLTELVLTLWEESDATSATRISLIGAMTVALHRAQTFIEEPEE